MITSFELQSGCAESDYQRYYLFSLRSCRGIHPVYNRARIVIPAKGHDLPSYHVKHVNQWDGAERSIEVEHRGAPLAVDDVPDEYDRLTALGVNFTQSPTDVGTAVMAVFDDTCGNLIQIVATKPEAQ